MASVIPVMLDKLAEMLEDRNDFSADTLKNIKTDDFYGYDPVIVYSPKTCVIIALNQESKKNVKIYFCLSYGVYLHNKTV